MEQDLYDEFGNYIGPDINVEGASGSEPNSDAEEASSQEDD